MYSPGDSIGSGDVQQRPVLVNQINDRHLWKRGDDMTVIAQKVAVFTRDNRKFRGGCRSTGTRNQQE
jgi:hypothetical protein